MKTIKLRDKRFLGNNHHEFGNVSWYVTLDKNKYNKNLKDMTLDAELIISDCSSSIHLDFECSVGKVDKRIEKLDTLIESLQLMREGLIEVKVEVDKMDVSAFNYC